METTATNLLDVPGVRGIVAHGPQRHRRATPPSRRSQEARRRLEAVLDIAGAAIFVTDLDGTCVLANRRARPCSAGARRDRRPRTHELLGPRRRAAGGARARGLRAGHALQFDEFLELGGESAPLLSHDRARSSTATGNATGLCGVATDITDRGRAQEEKEALETALAALAAHGLARPARRRHRARLQQPARRDPQLRRLRRRDARHGPPGGRRRGRDLARRPSAPPRSRSQLLVFSRHDHLRLEPVDVNEVALETQRLLDRTLGEDVELVVAPGRASRSTRWPTPASSSRC